MYVNYMELVALGQQFFVVSCVKFPACRQWARPPGHGGRRVRGVADVTGVVRGAQESPQR